MLLKFILLQINDDRLIMAGIALETEMHVPFGQTRGKLCAFL